MPDPDRTSPPASRQRPWRGAALGALALLCLVAPPPARAADPADTVLLFAAASLADALGEVAELFEDRTGHSVTLSAAGSAALARQILLGAPADLFISADPEWADVLEEGDRVEPGQRVDLLGNTLVLIGHGATGPPPAPPETLDLDLVLGSGRLAISLTDAVPAGRYGRAALQATGLWPAAEHRLAQTDNVRAALALVATGAAPAGIVYATDALAEPRVHVLARFPETTHPPIVYPLVDLAGRDGAAENALYDLLTGPEAAAIFEAHGFLVPAGQGAP
jgi:molybdate transport system substrate-binding protein